MRIAVDGRVLSLPEARGIASYLMEILRAWPEQPEGEERDEFILFTEDAIPAERYRSSADVRVVHVPSVRGSRFRVWDWYCLPAALNGRAYDLLWTPANVSLPVGGLRQVTTIHDTIVQECLVPRSMFERLLQRVVLPYWSRRYADRVITVSEFSGGRIAKVFGYSADRISVVPNGATFAERRFGEREQARAFLREKTGVERRFILALGAESAWKNTQGAIDAFTHVAQKQADIGLVIAGLQPRVLAVFSEQVRAAGLADRITLLPFTDRETRDALYQAAEVFLYPSLFEGFGLPPLEAMAAGTPVVASDAASIPEVVGDAAILVDARNAGETADALLHVLNDADVRAALISAGVQNIRRFDWRESAARHRAIFAELAEENRHGR
ncbi:glycosyltransferase family 4 protein [Desulfovibrio mangrovi]|uniref:glycosyltransferase family 4 protein n=1 Tax=Desulfovibrio mangrovi TaxID=2976983 RepID=UPI0022467792|nr:glycosyltransferase family 1 protein [Desulfovibrio mangrovi]UZP67562.1 glycosyltransferase family 4 protein [Desulfovibrio mangrovi]